jgi:hypothetical protein
MKMRVPEVGAFTVVLCSQTKDAFSSAGHASCKSTVVFHASVTLLTDTTVVTRQSSKNPGANREIKHALPYLLVRLRPRLETLPHGRRSYGDGPPYNKAE